MESDMQIKYVAKISSQGENFIVWIPKEYHDQVKKMKGKQVKITIDDEI
jgi:antitoxin component of MazEF toxin-antitoxin module